MLIMHFVLKRTHIVAQSLKYLNPSLRNIAFCTRIAAVAAGVVGCSALLLCLVAASASRPRYSEYLLNALKGPLQANDPELLEFVRNEVLIPPSTQPYALEGRRNSALQSVHSSETFYRNATRLIFSNTRKRIFVEAGALDGETMSNTLGLEKNKGWTGLLVEAEKIAFAQLLKKHRRSWLANVCLSPTPHPSVELFATKSSHLSAASATLANFKERAMGKLQRYRLGSCIPLTSLLLALNYRRVDLLVLDVEGAEMDIIRTLDFTAFDIQVIYLEWKDLSKHHEVSVEIKKKGYRLILHLTEDFVFLKKGTEFDAVLPGVDIKLPKS